MTKGITKKQQIRNHVNRLLQNETFITWSMLGVSPLNSYGHQTYDATIVFDYMKELGIEYLHYCDKYSDGRLHRITGGFYNDVAVRRKKKLQQINKNNKN